MVQLAYTQDIEKALPGKRLGLVEGEVINSFSNYSIAEKSYSVSVDAADLETSVSIDLHTGLSKSVAVNVGGGVATQDALAGLLATAINEDSDLNGYVSAEAGTASLEITYRFAGTDFSVSSVANTTPSVSVEKDSGEEIPFGYGVSYGEEDKVRLPDSGDSFAGVALLDSKLPKLPNSEGLAQERNSYKLDDTVSTLAKGRVFVPVMAPVSAGDSAFCSHDGADAGKWRADATNALATGGTFIKGAAAGELALLQL